jgi:hypothetical protein
MWLHLTIEIEITDSVHSCMHELLKDEIKLKQQLYRMNVFMLFIRYVHGPRIHPIPFLPLSLLLQASRSFVAGPFSKKKACTYI